MRRLTICLAALALSGCAAPVAKQYYAACIEAGYGAGECKMRAIQVNQQAWAAFGNSMSQASASFRAAGETTAAPVHTSTRCSGSSLGTFSSIDCHSVSH